MKIIVTGGAGFIGSHLVDRLIKDKYKVAIIDNLSTGSRKNLNPKAKFYHTDIRNYKKIADIFKRVKPDAVFHLAAQLDVRKSVADPIEDAQINIFASLNLIELSHKMKVKKFIFSSSGGAAYGDTKERPTKETLQEWPLSPYGIAKMTIDKYLHYYHEVHGLNFTSLRYANIYGPRQNHLGEGGVVAIFISKMLAGEQPLINGGGKQTRDYVYVDDVVSANILALSSISTNGIFNIGTGIETDVNQLFDKINKNFGSRFKKLRGPAKLGEQMTSCLSSQRAKKHLGWKVETDLGRGIKKTYAWFLKNNGK